MGWINIFMITKNENKQIYEISNTRCLLLCLLEQIFECDFA